MLTIVAYEARTAKSAKTGKDYAYQIIEVQQAPERPNAQIRRLYSDLSKAMAPGVYSAKVSFYQKGYELLPSFYDFQLIESTL